MKLRSVFLPLCLCSLFAFGQARTGAVRKLTLKSSKPGDQAVRLVNSGSENSVFTFRFNDVFFYSQEAIGHAIRNLDDAYRGEPLERKAWRFVSQYVTYNYPLSDNHWQRQPMILLNSIGFDKCGNQAEMLASIWHGLGFKTRIWALQGHVVPEVFADGAWQMYDPAFLVYYTNRDGSVCSAEMLMDHPELITEPLKRMDFPVSTTEILLEIIRYSDMISNLYATKENNKVYDPMVLSDPAVQDFMLTLPPGAAFEFPLLSKREFVPLFSFMGNNYANARLTVPQDWQGRIELPLVVCAIKGSGQVEVNGQTFEIGSQALSDYLTSFKTFNYQLGFQSPHKDVEVIYLVNVSFGKLKRSNELELQGENCTHVEAEVFTPSAELALKGSAGSIFSEQFMQSWEVYEKHKQELDSLLQDGQQVDWTSLGQKLSTCMQYIELKDEAAVLEKFHRLKQMVPPKLSGQLFTLLKDPACVVIFTCLLDFYTTDELVSIASRLVDKKRNN